MAKILIEDPTSKVINVISDKFKQIRNRYSLNLDSVLQKSFARAFDIGISTNPSAKAKKMIIKNKLRALKKNMLGDIDNIENESSQNIARTISTAYAQGVPSGKIRTQMMDNIGAVDFKVDRAIRTNTTKLSSLAKLKVWEEMGFKKYQWILGKNDKVTRKNHKSVHKRVFLIKDALANRAPYPGNWPGKNGKINLGESINCRCGIRLADDNARASRTYNK